MSLEIRLTQENTASDAVSSVRVSSSFFCHAPEYGS